MLECYLKCGAVDAAGIKEKPSELKYLFKDKLASDMLTYCKRDTEAMACILEKLKRETDG